MSLTKKKTKKIIGMLKDGVSLQTVLMMIIQVADNPLVAARVINDNFWLCERFEGEEGINWERLDHDRHLLRTGI